MTVHQSLRLATRPRGLATLAVVMILFFILAMVAAYTNRTLIIDQRASANNLRSAMAIEAAEAGIEWALMQLNGARVDATCLSSVQQSDLEFRSRYLQLLDEGIWKDVTYTSSGTVYNLAPSCVANAGAWTCTCPTVAAPTPSLVLPAGGLGQAFRIYFQQPFAPGIPEQGGTIRIVSQGCSNLGSDSNNCISTATVPKVDAVAQVAAVAGLVRALPFAPAAAITAGTTINGNTLVVTNTDPSTGLTLHAGGAINIDTANSQLHVPAGSPGEGRVACYDALWSRRVGAPVRGAACPGPEPAADGRYFQSFFGMDIDSYRRQPGLRLVDCTNGCTSADLTDALARFPGRAIWLDGSLALDTAATIGTAAQPVVLIVTGNLAVNAAVTYRGLLYANSINWNVGAATAVIEGAIVSESYFDAFASPTATVTYNAAILSTIRLSYGSFVRVPGSMQYF